MRLLLLISGWLACIASELVLASFLSPANSIQDIPLHPIYKELQVKARCTICQDKVCSPTGPYQGEGRDDRRDMVHHECGHYMHAPCWNNWKATYDPNGAHGTHRCATGCNCQVDSTKAVVLP